MGRILSMLPGGYRETQPKCRTPAGLPAMDRKGLFDLFTVSFEEPFSSFSWTNDSRSLSESWKEIQ